MTTGFRGNPSAIRFVPHPRKHTVRWCEKPFSHLRLRESLPATPHNRHVRAMGRYRADENLVYFCTITVLDWLPVLIEDRYIDPIVDSLQFCRNSRGLQVFAYVVMPNHIHLIAGVAEGHSDSSPTERSLNGLQAVMRDFKRFTSRTIHDRLKEDGRETILKWLRDATEHSRRARGELGLWQAGFHPQAVFSRKVFEQKLRYLHENPARKGLVRHPDDWYYSSAATYSGGQSGCMDVDCVES